MPEQCPDVLGIHASGDRRLLAEIGKLLHGRIVKDPAHEQQLFLKAASDDHLWAEDYDRKVDDVFSVESEVAGAIATALAARVTPGERAEIAARPAANPRAYDLYLRGLVFAHKNDDTSLHTAVQFFQQVVKEAKKVTWPTMRETGYTTVAVFVMVALTMIFFFAVDTVLAYGERLLIGAAG